MSDMHDAVRTPPAASQDLTGTTVGRFNILARLVPAHGEVYRAEDTKLRRTVAIKRMAPVSTAIPSRSPACFAKVSVPRPQSPIYAGAQEAVEKSLYSPAKR